jgi:hypothetical protein
VTNLAVRQSAATQFFRNHCGKGAVLFEFLIVLVNEPAHGVIFCRTTCQNRADLCNYGMAVKYW